jgi:predicted metal-dependent phosphoesterase TrpH
MQVDVLAITDHDTVAGLDAAHAKQAEQKRPLKIIDGVEISTTWHGFDIHIVGLNVNRDCPTFLARLNEQANARQPRAELIGEKLVKCGFNGVLERAMALAGEGQVTRAHFARVLVNNYGVPTMEAAFKKYLGKGKRAAVKAQWPSIETAILWIQEAGGQAVLAHPAHYDMTAKWLRRLVLLFAQSGGDAMETAFPGINKTKQMLINELALEHNLLASAGSDFHFPSRWTELGKNLGINSELTPIWQTWPHENLV